MPTFYVPACLRAIRRRRRHRWIVAAIHPLCTSPYRVFFSLVLCLCLYTLCYIKLLLFYFCSIARTTTPFDLVSLNLHSQCSHSCCQRAYKHIVVESWNVFDFISFAALWHWHSLWRAMHLHFFRFCLLFQRRFDCIMCRLDFYVFVSNDLTL